MIHQNQDEILCIKLIPELEIHEIAKWKYVGMKIKVRNHNNDNNNNKK